MFKLALKDLLFDRLISACQIAAIAAILAPLLLLFSLRYGVLTELQDKLLQDPKVLALTLDTSYRLDEEFFRKLRQEPEVGFVIPEVAALSALVDIRFKNGAKRVSIMATAPGDPVISGSGIDFNALRDKSTLPEGAGQSLKAQFTASVGKVTATDPSELTDKGTEANFAHESGLAGETDGAKFTEANESAVERAVGLRDDESFISEDLALERGVKVGDQILVLVSRTLNGQRQVARVKFTIRGVVKQRFLNDDFVVTNLRVVTYLDDYRTGYEPPIFSDGSYVKTTPRYYAKFRLFARDIDAVIPLYYKLVAQHLNVSSKVGEIENIQAITRVLNFIFIVIAAVSGVGGALALGGLMLSSLKSRKRNFVLLRLMGQSNTEIYGLVALENFILASLGFGLAWAFYLAGSSLFNQYFGALLPEAVISQLKLEHSLLFYGITLGVAGFLALISAKYIFLKAQIADVLREA